MLPFLLYPIRPMAIFSAPKRQWSADRRLLDLVSRGDEGALKAIYERCSSRAYGIALRILGTRPDADEVLQETFLEVWTRAREYSERRGALEAWVVTIARSRAIDRLRARLTAAKITEAYPPLSMGGQGPAQIEAVERRQERECVQAALNSLPAEQRSVLELAYFEGLSQTEIAQRMGDPLGTVKTRIRLGMEKLADILGAAEGAS
jgi:RNA polymerase sigma-70 factor, ECF subfamily